MRCSGAWGRLQFGVSRRQSAQAQQGIEHSAGHVQDLRAGLVLLLVDRQVDVFLVQVDARDGQVSRGRSEEHTSELQSLMRISYAVFCLKKKNTRNNTQNT